MLDDEAIDDIKTYLQTIKKPRNIQIDSHIHQVKTLNTYIPLMDTVATKLTNDSTGCIERDSNDMEP